MSDDARELAIYAINNANLYRQKIVPVIKNLRRKIAKGKYDPALALFSWCMIAEEGAKLYTKEFMTPGNKWYENFPPPVRQDAAKEIAAHYDSELTGEE